MEHTPNPVPFIVHEAGMSKLTMTLEHMMILTGVSVAASVALAIAAFYSIRNR